ncbi:hypothetical protein MTO96_042463 [Rhipicephalus appendiculatus]
MPSTKPGTSGTAKRGSGTAKIISYTISSSSSTSHGHRDSKKRKSKRKRRYSSSDTSSSSNSLEKRRSTKKKRVWISLQDEVVAWGMIVHSSESKSESKKLCQEEEFTQFLHNKAQDQKRTRVQQRHVRARAAGKYAKKAIETSRHRSGNPRKTM